MAVLTPGWIDTVWDEVDQTVTPGNAASGWNVWSGYIFRGNVAVGFDVDGDSWGWVG